MYDVANTNEQTELPEYTLGWLPEGYEEVERYSDPKSTWVIYANSAMDKINFMYSNASTLYINPDNDFIRYIIVDGRTIELYYSRDTKNSVIWFSSDNTVLFSLTGNFTEDSLISIIKNVNVI